MLYREQRLCQPGFFPLYRQGFHSTSLERVSFLLVLIFFNAGNVSDLGGGGGVKTQKLRPIEMLVVKCLSVGCILDAASKSLLSQFSEVALSL